MFVAPSGKTNNTGRWPGVPSGLSTTFAVARPDCEGLSTAFPRSVRIAGRGYRLVVAVVSPPPLDPVGAGPAAHTAGSPRPPDPCRCPYPPDASVNRKLVRSRSLAPGARAGLISRPGFDDKLVRCRVGHRLRARMAPNTRLAGAYRDKAAGGA